MAPPPAAVPPPTAVLPPAAAPPPKAAPLDAPAGREAALFGDPSVLPPPALQPTTRAAPADPLSIGGQLYLRAATSFQQGVAADEATLSLPWLIDLWLDAKPNDRVRAMLRTRTRFEPSQAEPTDDAATVPGWSMSGPGPDTDIDQLWVSFDIARVAFVTAGRQHVKWGPSRFWSPTDFLHQIRRDPLAPFDARLGTTMVKLQVPWRETGASFTGVALLDSEEPVGQLGQAGAAGRVEALVAGAELGLDLVHQQGRHTRLGLDVSTGLGPLDVYAEAALRRGSDDPHWQKAGSFPLAGGKTFVLGAEKQLASPIVGGTVGFEWSYKYNDEDVLTVGGEYFYNSQGYDDPDLYPWLILQQGLEPEKQHFVPFYLGRHYAGAFFLLPGPGSWDDTTWVFSTLGNLSDRSFLSRLDFSVLALTHLRVEAYGAVHYGTEGGELRFGLDIPRTELDGGLAIPAIDYPPPTWELGVGLRLAI